MDMLSHDAINFTLRVLQNGAHFDTDSSIEVSLSKHYYLPNNIMLFNTLGEIIKGLWTRLKRHSHEKMHMFFYPIPQKIINEKHLQYTLSQNYL